MNVSTRVLDNGLFKVSATQGEVHCTATMPKSKDAVSIALRSCHQIVEVLEALEKAHSGCSNCD